eukprot:scaffold605853_cov18-Prasinocladus_malaysianus.AAC.1
MTIIGNRTGTSTVLRLSRVVIRADDVRYGTRMQSSHRRLPGWYLYSYCGSIDVAPYRTGTFKPVAVKGRGRLHR